MSETIGTPYGAASDPGSSTRPVHEAYSFACMRCGHGWEQSYEISHHTDESGRMSVVYRAGGQRVPSPLTRPTCGNCGGHLVRIMRAGRVLGASWEPVEGRGRLTGAGAYGGTPRPPRLEYGARDLAGRAPIEGETGMRHHWLAELLGFLRRVPWRHGDAGGRAA